MSQRDIADARQAHASVGRCQPCGKQLYRTRKDARVGSRRATGQGHMSVYECPRQEGYWHYGHLPDAVRRGEVTKDAYEQRTRQRLSAQAAFVGAPLVVTIPNPRDAACIVDALDAAADVLEQVGNSREARRYAGLRDRFADVLDKAAVPPCNDGRPT